MFVSVNMYMCCVIPTRVQWTLNKLAHTRTPFRRIRASMSVSDYFVISGATCWCHGKQGISEQPLRHSLRLYTHTHTRAAMEYHLRELHFYMDFVFRLVQVNGIFVEFGFVVSEQCRRCQCCSAADRRRTLYGDDAVHISYAHQSAHSRRPETRSVEVRHGLRASTQSTVCSGALSEFSTL